MLNFIRSFIFSLTLSLCAAAPVVTSVTNAASNTVVDLPSSGIAQGSMFVIKGTDLGSATLAIATVFPLNTSIGGSSVSVTVGGVTRAAIMYYSTAGQLAAILPSTIPVGTGTITVTNNGLTSASFPIKVVRTTIGVFTVNQSGGGDAIATLGPALVTPLNAANPGDIVAFWATGLGPADFDESNPAQQFDMTTIPVEAWVGGKPAEILFRGRNACCSSVDAIYVKIPAGVTGCLVPVVFKTGDYVSNTTSIATATSGRTCAPLLPTLTTSDIQTLLAKPKITNGFLYLLRNQVVGLGVGASFDGGDARFGWYAPLAGGLGGIPFDLPAAGSCVVFNGQQFGGAWSGVGASQIGLPVTVRGTAGTRSFLPNIGIVGFDFPGAIFRPGEFEVSAPGGADIGAIAANVTIADPLLDWTNQASLNNVDRAAGVTLTWTGGDPNGFVTVAGFATSPAGTGAAFRCGVPRGQTSFVIPSYVTLAMPRSTPALTVASALWIQSASRVTRFAATGLDLGFAFHMLQLGKGVTWTGAAGIE